MAQIEADCAAARPKCCLFFIMFSSDSLAQRNFWGLIEVLFVSSIAPPWRRRWLQHLLEGGIVCGEEATYDCLLNLPSQSGFLFT